MISTYIQKALARARYEMLPEDGSCYGEIPGCEGVYATGETVEACRHELSKTLEDWILFRVSKGLPIPMLDGVQIKVEEVAFA